MGKRAEAENVEATVKKSKKALADTVAEEAEPETPKKEKNQKHKQIVVEEAVEDADAEKAKRKDEKRKRKQAAADALAAAEEPTEEQAPRKKAKTDAAAEEKEKKDLIDAGTEVFVGGLPFTCTEEALRKYFAKCGEIQSLKLPSGKGAKKHNRGIAFITFSSEKGVRKAIKFNGEDYEGRALRVSADQRAKKEDTVKSDREDTVKSDKGTSKGKGNSALRVFLAGLPFKATESILRKDFGECGEIESFTMPLNEEGRPRGIAFIGYKTQEGVDKALAFEGTEYGGRTLHVSKAVKGKDCKGKSKGKGKDEGI